MYLVKNLLLSSNILRGNYFTVSKSTLLYWGGSRGIYILHLHLVKIEIGISKYGWSYLPLEQTHMLEAPSVLHRRASP